MKENHYKIHYGSATRDTLARDLDCMDLARLKSDFTVIPVVGTGVRVLSRIEPGLFITGGSARSMALETISGVDEREIPSPTDVDWITFGNRRIYTGDTPITSERRKMPSIPEASGVLLEYFTGADFNVDALFAGRFHPNECPSLYLTEEAASAYQDRILDFTACYRGVRRDGCGKAVRIDNNKAALRAIMLEQRLGNFSFVSRIDHVLLKESLTRNWRNLLINGDVADYASRAEHDGYLDGFIQTLAELGFTIPSGQINMIKATGRPQMEEWVMAQRKKSGVQEQLSSL